MDKIERALNSQVVTVFKDTVVSINGPLTTGDTLAKELGYGSRAALQQAIYRDNCPVTVFPLPHRHKKFALYEDVVNWLVQQRVSNCNVELVGSVSPSVSLKAFVELHGCLLHGAEIISLLGLPDLAVPREQAQEGMIPFPVFRMDGRRKKLFALSVEAFSVVSG